MASSAPHKNRALYPRANACLTAKRLRRWHTWTGFYGASDNFKTVTSRLLRKHFKAALEGVYRQPVLWSRTYFVASCGGAPLAVIQQYIQQQERPHL